MAKVDKTRTPVVEIKDPGIVVDPPELPHFVNYDNEYVLNRQTAYNEHLLKTVDRCGCFHCGRIFDPALISDWLVEDDGSRSALCPFCLEDAIIIGTKEAPLCTAILSGLYAKWYCKYGEYYGPKDILRKLPFYRSDIDYLKRGLVFYKEPLPDCLILGTVDIRYWYAYDIFPNEELGELTNHTYRAAEDGSGGVVNVRMIRFPVSGYKRYDCYFFSDDREIVPYEIWREDERLKVRDLCEKYGDRLRGLINTPFAAKMVLFAD